MPRIRCLYLDCNFLENQYCTANSVEIDSDIGCTTYIPGNAIDILDDDDLDNDDDDYEAWDAEDLNLDDDDADEDEW